MELLNPLADASFPARTVAYTGTAGSTSTWPPGPQGVVVWCTTDAYIFVGVDTAVATTANGTPLPANTPVPFVTPNEKDGAGRPWSVSAIQVASGGTLYAKPINIR